MADFVDKKGCDDVFSWDFRRDKAVKFNSGQYMNDTLEGGPWAPILWAAISRERPFLGNIRYSLT